MTSKPIHGDSCVGKITSEYHAWKSLRARCNNPKRADYARYGGKGIRVCERWNNYENFLADMGRKPGPKYSIDRIDSTKNYSPENCRWATRTEQANNRSIVRRYLVGGQERTLNSLCAEFGAHPNTAHWRLRRGSSIEFAVMPNDLFKVLTT